MTEERRASIRSQEDFERFLADAPTKSRQPAKKSEWTDMGNGYEQRLIVDYNSISITTRIKKPKKKGRG